jgi:hypothetical protein
MERGVRGATGVIEDLSLPNDAMATTGGSYTEI